jgi:hypothetical protein
MERIWSGYGADMERVWSGCGNSEVRVPKAEAIPKFEFRQGFLDCGRVSSLKSPWPMPFFEGEKVLPRGNTFASNTQLASCKAKCHMLVF